MKKTTFNISFNEDKASALGSQTAITVEGKLTEAIDTLYQEYGKDIPRDTDTAIYYLQLAVEHGNQLRLVPLTASSFGKHLIGLLVLCNQALGYRHNMPICSTAEG